MKDIGHAEVMAQILREDPAYAAALLAEVCLDGDAAELSILMDLIEGAIEARRVE
jgi:DNA-binding phage protein